MKGGVMMTKVYERSIHTTASKETDKFKRAVSVITKAIKDDAEKEGYELGTIQKAITGDAVATKIVVKATGVKKIKEMNESGTNETSRKKNTTGKPNKRKK